MTIRASSSRLHPGTLAGEIAAARRSLIEASFRPEDAALDAEVLARDLLGWDRARLLAESRRPAPAGFAVRYRQSVARRLKREPVAMITGHREFWGLDFRVTSATLVPRPETEIIVEEALRVLADRSATVLDIGTGTGCLAVALAHDRQQIRAVATDVSHEALLVARGNARANGVAERVHFVQTDLAAGLAVRADVIVSNPPYVPDQAAAALPADVVRYEPATALFGGSDGLAVIRRLLASVGECLAPGGRVILEFGYGQEDEVRELAESAGWKVARVLNDLQGIARTIVLGR
jgi:release factor glutamine methyltransferase